MHSNACQGWTENATIQFSKAFLMICHPSLTAHLTLSENVPEGSAETLICCVTTQTSPTVAH